MIEHMQRIDGRLWDCAVSKDVWKQRHHDAWHSHNWPYLPQAITALAAYADGHYRRYGSPIGDDYVLGDQWRDAIVAIRGLLNGDCGGLDCGLVDSLLCHMLTAEGFSPDTLERLPRVQS